jgi:hypothetical protein
VATGPGADADQPDLTAFHVERADRQWTGALPQTRL